jgi:hypothetical protein
MLEVLNLNDSKNLMKNLNVIIYGSIRNIETHFLKSFSNIELLSSMFKNVYIIIFENDSTDNTRGILQNWYSHNGNPHMIKHIILQDNLDKLHPLRAHRLAYCRNAILGHIFNNNLQNSYQYAIHCDLDDRFWRLNYNSIANCFQYDLSKWDGMFPINKNTYYDFWALRCPGTWFNKNIFSCDADYETEKNYISHVSEFLDFINKNKNSLINVNSAFNGLGIYKLSSMINCKYSADFFCNKCFGKKYSCLEDNDHIGLHKEMIFTNGAKLFINTNMYIECNENNYMNYTKFINDITNIPTLNKNILKYSLIQNWLNPCDAWLNFSEKSGNFENMISNYTENDVYSFTNFENPSNSNSNFNDIFI